MEPKPLTGRCLCGAVKFQLTPPVRDVIVCHCRQCAQWTGYAVAATAVAIENFEVTKGAGEIGWYRSSGHADRGFCKLCGSSLFWRPVDGARMSVLAGSLEPPTGLHVGAHIFTANKSDYYQIGDGAPQYEAGAGAVAAVPKR
jgi:hypothetical protein